MTVRLASCALALAAAAGSVPAPAQPEPADMRRARDGNIAIQQELDAARKAATVEAYDLFLARHPDHPLARVARAERQRLLEAHRTHQGHPRH